MKSIAKMGRIGNTRIIIHWSFLLLLLWVVVINFISVIKPEEILWCLILIVAYLFSLMIHEYSHALAGILCGYRRNEIFLLPTGAVGRPLNHSLRTLEKTLIFLSGPAANLIIAAILKFFIQPYTAYWNEPENIGVVTRGNFLFQLQLINLGLGVVNLIPALPFDGGHILSELLATKMKYEKANRITGQITRAIAYVSLFVGIATISLLPVLFGIYVGLTCTAEDEYIKWKQAGRKSVLRMDNPNILLETKGMP